MANQFSVDVPNLATALQLGGKAYDQSRKAAEEAEAKQAQSDAAGLIAKGDYNGAMSVLAKAGKIEGSTLATYGLARQKHADETAASGSAIRLLLGGGISDPAGYGAGSPSAGMRAEVPSSPAVWGDAEAPRAGLYEEPRMPSPVETLLGGGPMAAKPAPQNSAYDLLLGSPASARVGGGFAGLAPSPASGPAVPTARPAAPGFGPGDAMTAQAAPICAAAYAGGRN